MTAMALRGAEPAFAWVSAITLSLIANALLVALLLVAIEPDAVPFTDEIKTRFQLSALDVPAHRAEAEDAKGEAAEESEATGEQLGVRSVPSSRARPVDPVREVQSARDLQSTAAPAVRPGSTTMAAASAPSQRLASAPAAAAGIEARDATGQRAVAAVPSAAPVSAVAAVGSPARPVETLQAVQAARAPESARATAVKPGGVTMAAARTPERRIASATPAAAAVTARAAVGQRAAAAVPAAVPVAAAKAAGGERIVSRRAPVREALGATSLTAQRAVLSVSRGPKLASAVLPAATALVIAAPTGDSGSALRGAVPKAAKAATIGPTAERIAGLEAGGAAVAVVAPATSRATSAEPQAVAVASRPAAAVAGLIEPANTTTAAVATRAAIAWSGDSNMVLDEQSLAAIQSFMQPGEVARSASFGGSVRDGIGAALAQFPCSRLQAAFQPETGQLEIRGHVPAPALKADVVAMLEQSVGGAIPVGSSLLVLPAPQCGVLEAAEGLGFLQSKDQENDPLEVGKEAQAQILSFEETQRVVFSLQAPEFDAYIYVDYYDKDGTVVHVLPNSYLEDNRYPANANFTLGDGQDAGGGLEMRVAPPFSQDIAVVLGTTHPLHEAQRPLQEDAEEYLSWLRNRIRDIQIEAPEFRGEWAYLFVRTGPQGAFE